MNLGFIIKVHPFLLSADQADITDCLPCSLARLGRTQILCPRDHSEQASRFTGQAHVSPLTV